MRFFNMFKSSHYSRSSGVGYKTNNIINYIIIIINRDFLRRFFTHYPAGIQIYFQSYFSPLGVDFSRKLEQILINFHR
jgi:hypothetical protein